jgi:PAS domain S-box-containing protein
MTTAIPLRVSERDSRRLSGLLAALVIGAASLLLFTLIENTLAARDLNAARQCAFLSADSLWVWSVTQRHPPPAPVAGSSSGALVLTRPSYSILPPDLASPETMPHPAPLVPPTPALAPTLPPASTLPGDTPPSGDWRRLFTGMQVGHDHLRALYPHETKALNAAWAGFADSLHQYGGVTWPQTAALGAACRAFANRLQARADGRRRLSETVSGLGLSALLGLFVWASALSQRRSLEAARTEDELERRDTLLDATGEGIYQVDARGSCIYINPAGAALLGYQPKELWGKEMVELLYRAPEGDVAPFDENPLQVALRTGAVAQQDDGLLWRRDGSCFPAATLASPILAPGGPQGAVVTFSDITGRKQAETLRDDLTGMIVHDLRTPLTSLLSGLQALRFVGGRGPDEQEILDNAIGGGETLLGMVNDLLDISKWESGSLVLDKKPLQPADVIEYALAQTAPLARRNGLRVARNIPPGLPVTDADRDLLRRSLTNLLGNAVKFTPRGGIVTVSASFDPVEGAILFAVGDTGEGIPAHQVRRIFDKFGQVESRKAGRRMSTGLGLTFCKLVAEAHGGRIWVESKLGKGSRFLFTIPLPPEAPH